MPQALLWLDENLAVAGGVFPQLVDNDTAVSNWISMADFTQLMFTGQVGATDITVDAKLQAATDSSGTGAADITGKAITQIAADEDNGRFTLSVKDTELSSTQTHVALVFTVGDGTAGAQVSATAHGIGTDHLPATLYDSSTVVEIVH